MDGNGEGWGRIICWGGVWSRVRLICNYYV